MLLRKAIISIAIFVTGMSGYVDAMSEIQIIDESTGIVPGAVYYKIHGYPQCERHGWGRDFIPFQECSEIAAVKHNMYRSNPDLVVTLHDKNWNLLAYGELDHSEHESDETYIEGRFLDPHTKPEAIRAVVYDNIFSERFIIFYDRIGVIVLNSRFDGELSCDDDGKLILEADELAQFKEYLDLASLASIEYRRVSCCDVFKHMVKSIFK
jgi:hypothetical protein